MADLTIRIRGDASGGVDAVEIVEGALGDLGKEASSTFKKVSKDAEDSAKKVETAFSKLGTSFRRQFTKDFRSAFRGIIPLVGNVVSGVVRAFSVLPSLIGSVFSAITSVVSSVFNGLVKIAGVAVKAISTVLSGLSSTIGLVFNKFTAIIAAATAFVVFKLGEQAGAFEELRGAGARLADGVNETMSSMVQAVQRGSEQTISRLDAMRFVNLSLSFAVVKSAKDMENLTATAVRLGQSIRLNATFALESLVTGLARSSVRWLDNLTLLVKAEKAYEDFAKSSDKATAALTDSEKRLALLRAAQVKVREEWELLPLKLRDYEGAQDDLNTVLQIGNRTMADFTRVLGAAGVEEVLVQQRAIKLKEAIAALSDEEKTAAFRAAALTEAARKLEDIGPVAVGLATRFARITTVFKDLFLDLSLLVKPSLELVLDAIIPVIQKFGQWATSIKLIAESKLLDFTASMISRIERWADLLINVLIPAVIGWKDSLLEVVPVINEKLAQAWDVVERVSSAVLKGMTLAISFVVREAGLLIDALNGEGFDAEESGIIKGIELLGAKGKEVSIEFALNFSRAFEDVSVSIIEGIRDIEFNARRALGVALTVGEVVTGAVAGALQVGNITSAGILGNAIEGAVGVDFSEASRSLGERAREQFVDPTPMRATGAEIRSDLTDRLAIAQQETAEAVAAFAPIQEEVVESAAEMEAAVRETTAQVVDAGRRTAEALFGTADAAAEQTAAQKTTADLSIEAANKTTRAIKETQDVVQIFAQFQLDRIREIETLAERNAAILRLVTGLPLNLGIRGGGTIVNTGG